MQYTITLPYLESVQIVGLKIPVHVWYDGPGSLMRMDVYGGLDSTYVLPNVTFNAFPRILKKACWRLENTAGPTADEEVEGKLREEGTSAPLPDISAWQYAGSTKMPGGTEAYIWSLTENHWEKTNTYSFYTSRADGRPLKLYMAGVNLFSGSHFDEYIVDFVLFNALHPGAAAVFKPPPVCDSPIDPPSAALSNSRMGAATATQSQALLPSAMVGAPETGAEAVAAVALELDLSGSGSGSGPDSSTMASNRLYVAGWNKKHAAERSFRLSLNRFAGWPHERFAATRLGLASPSKAELAALRRRPGSAYLGAFQRQLSDGELPTHVDYRGTGADGVVKDQASCGSCWAFGTTGTMTGTWFKATGEALSLSEQQIVDCSWDYHVNGCWGGFGESAMDFVRAAGGATMEDDYPYLGQNGYCRSNLTAKAAMFKGYQDIAEGDELALMEALATKGPLYVALDAGHPTFKFYSEGVYHREDCATDRDHLNHAVTLVGYGTTEQGVDYWLIRNSWSKMWGEDGYMKITRKGNDCGITTGAMLAVVDEAAAAKAAARVQLQQQQAKTYQSRKQAAGGGVAAGVVDAS